VQFSTQNADSPDSSSQRWTYFKRFSTKTLLRKDSTTLRTLQSHLSLQVSPSTFSPENSPEKPKYSKPEPVDVQQIIDKKINVETVPTQPGK
jgi:hypothetical protein